jgi:EmrB/QacA subfamily drug resistance transporter
LVLLAIGIGTFMTALDGSVVNTILPIINTSFNSNIAIIEWVVTIYLLIVSGLLLSFGRLGDMRGNKNIYIAGFSVFIISSVLCGLSPSVHVLILFRGIQAFGAAMLAANSPAILTKSFPATQRGQALGMQATMTYLGLVVGPSLGGWLAEFFSWRAVFYINLPVGLLALALSLKFILPDKLKSQTESFDIWGALVFMAGLVALLLGLNQGYAIGWTSPIILGLLGASVALLTAFVIIEKRIPYPMLDLSLFLNRTFSSTTVSAVLNYITVYVIIFLLPFYMIQGRGFSPSQTGLMLTTQSIVMAIVAPISGTLSDRIGTRIPAVSGMALLAIGTFTLSTLGPATELSQIILSLAICGLGIGIFISPNNSALMGSAPRYRQGIAAGTMATARSVGMVLGVGLAGAILTTQLGHQSASQNPALFDAIQISFIVTTVLALLGALTSIIQQREDLTRSKQR